MAELIAQFPLLSALIALVGLGAVFGALLGFAAVRFRTEGNPIVDQINDILPQTQCGQCGHPGCRPYAEAIANGEEINKCPPGGEAGIQALADLLDMEVIPLDEEHGEEDVKKVAYIREPECSPVDCIDMIPAQEEGLQTWHWQLPDPVSRQVEIIATDAPAARDQAA
jgi:electron transport complex protein RnfB